jgi:hypothetical protein
MEAVTEKMIALSPPTSVREIAARGHVAIGVALTYIKSMTTRLIASAGCRGGSPLCRARETIEATPDEKWSENFTTAKGDMLTSVVRRIRELRKKLGLAPGDE